MDNAELNELRRHLRAQYAGVFDEKIIEQHIAEYVDTATGERLMAELGSRGLAGGRMLDIGCGYGAVVLAARAQGMDATGIELAVFEVEFARARLRRQRPQDDPARVYQQGDALALPFAGESFDVVTLINVLEHVPDYRKALAEAVRVLRPVGLLYAICPNYAAFRREAHYLVPWLPLMPKRLGVLYLRGLGRNPGFLRDHVHYCTNWGVLRALSRLPVETGDPAARKLEDPAAIGSAALRAAVTAAQTVRLLWIARAAARLAFYNPFRNAVWVTAIKRSVP